MTDPADASTAAGFAGLRIEVVEDDLPMCDDLVAFFRWRGAQVRGHGSAEAFWAALDPAAPPALLLLDLGLPGEGGLALAARLRRQLPLVGVVMLTAFGSDDDRIAGLEGGADAYIVKGRSLELLEATCRSVLRRMARLVPPATSAPARAAHPPGDGEGAAGRWQLDSLLARLRTPGGQVLRLTHLELIFLSALMAAPGTAVARTELLARMERPDDLEQLRALDGCAARLRRKVQDLTGEVLPLRSFYGRGYVFGAPALVSA